MAMSPAAARLISFVVRIGADHGSLNDKELRRLRRLGEEVGYEDARDLLAYLVVGIFLPLKRGWKWNSKRRDWVRPLPRGRPRNSRFEQAMELGRTRLRDRLGAEPTLAAVAEHVREDPKLRAMAGVSQFTEIESILRHYRRRSG